MLIEYQFEKKYFANDFFKRSNYQFKKTEQQIFIQKKLKFIKTNQLMMIYDFEYIKQIITNVQCQIQIYSKQKNRQFFQSHKIFENINQIVVNSIFNQILTKNNVFNTLNCAILNTKKIIIFE